MTPNQVFLKIKSRRLRNALGLIMLGVIWYLLDCAFQITDHPDLPWFERGIYAGSPFGFYMDAMFVVAGLGYFIFRKDQ